MSMTSIVVQFWHYISTAKASIYGCDLAMKNLTALDVPYVPFFQKKFYSSVVYIHSKLTVDKIVVEDVGRII